MLFEIFFILSNTFHWTQSSSEKAVMNAIFKDYSPFVRPVRNHSNSIKVILDPALYGIYEVNWQDEYLQWDPEEFGGIEMIKPPAKLLWQPDITLYGMIGVTNTLEKDRSLVHLNYTGHVLLSVGQNIRVHCTYDVAKFPYDAQECILHYTSWMYHNGEVSLYPKDVQGVDQYFQRNTEWTLKSFLGERKIFSYVEGTYSEVFYRIQMVRKPLYYMLTIVVPSFTITSLALIGLFSPFNSGGERQEKVTMGLTTLLTMAVLLLMVSNEMPKTSDGMPLLGMFIMVELLVASGATVAAVGVMYMHRYGSSRHPPHWLLALTCLPPPDCLVQPSQQPDKAPKPPVHLQKYTTLPGDFPEAYVCRSQNKISSHSLYAAHGDNHAPAITQKDTERSLLLQFCVQNLKEMSDVVTEWKTDNELAMLWTKICDRVDVFLIIFFLLFHLGLTIYFFGPML